MTNYAPCPKCGGTASERMNFTWWGGVIGPKVLTHVKCPQCRTTYNGKSGKDNTTNIVIYSVVVGLIAFAFVGALFAALAILSVSTR